MAKPVPLPQVNRRKLSLLLSIGVLVAGAAYVTIVREPEPSFSPALQAFRNECMRSARLANGGGEFVMDDDTEARIGAYCGCVADAVAANVSPEEIARLAEDGAAEATHRLLERIIAGCRPQLQ